MTALITTVFVASVLGSLHCAGMCGAFVAMAIGFEGDRPVSRASLHAAYNGGRLVTYTLLGVFAGALGRAMDMGGSAFGLSRTAALVAAGVMIVAGSTTLLRLLGVRTLRVHTPRAVESVVVAGHRAAMRFSPTWRAGLIGLLTIMLPCGWLYAFAALAAGTASPVLGGATMAAFWLGTLPALLSIGALVRAAAGRFGRPVQAAMAMIIIIAGVDTAAHRLGIDMSAPMHEMVEVSLGELTERAATLDPEDAVCCVEDAGDD